MWNGVHPSDVVLWDLEGRNEAGAIFLLFWLLMLASTFMETLGFSAAFQSPEPHGCRETSLVEAFIASWWVLRGSFRIAIFWPLNCSEQRHSALRSAIGGLLTPFPGGPVWQSGPGNNFWRPNLEPTPPSPSNDFVSVQFPLEKELKCWSGFSFLQLGPDDMLAHQLPQNVSRSVNSLSVSSSTGQCLRVQALESDCLSANSGSATH